MTTTVDAEPNPFTAVALERAEWLTGLHDIFEFFTAHPEMIDGMNITVSHWLHNDDTAREQVVRFSALTGANAVKEMSPGSTYVQVDSDLCSPHLIRVYASKEAVGHKVRDAVPEEWDWGALAGQS
jgi:hypothetical protein